MHLTIMNNNNNKVSSSRNDDDTDNNNDDNISFAKAELLHTLEEFERCVLETKSLHSQQQQQSNHHHSITGPLLPSQIAPTCWRAPQIPVSKQEEEQARKQMIKML